MTAQVLDRDVPLLKTITVRSTVNQAFRVFTDGIDAWWPRTHHIGKSPMKRVIVEPFVGGRCYTEQVDGTECDWGRVLTWEPPHRLVLAWQITHEWGYEQDLAKSSEVEVRFSSEQDGSTRVELEHRHFDRMGPGGATMKAAVSAPGGWGDLLRLFTERAEQSV